MKRNVSGHTDTPRDRYVEELIEIIKKQTPRKKNKQIKIERKNEIFQSSAVNVYAGFNGKKSGGWYDIDNCYE